MVMEKSYSKPSQTLRVSREGQASYCTPRAIHQGK